MRAEPYRRSDGPAPRLAKLLLGIVLLVSSVAAWSVEPVAPREYQLKAAFLFNFAKFIDWPAPSFVQPDAPIIIGVLGETPLAAALEEVARDRKINGRSVLFKRVSLPEEAAHIHILFVGAHQEAGFAQLQADLGHSPILTVGETPAFAVTGGTINFVVRENKVRFEINMASAERAGLKVSSQLQNLALAVVRKP